jgi:hypothetical protein
VEQTVLSIRFDLSDASMLYASRGWPQSARMFFPGNPRLLPLAGMMDTIFMVELPLPPGKPPIPVYGAGTPPPRRFPGTRAGYLIARKPSKQMYFMTVM